MDSLEFGKDWVLEFDVYTSPTKGSVNILPEALEQKNKV
jgi:hypothetical protein